MVLSKSYETLTLKLCPFFNLILFSSNDWRSHYCSISSDVDRQQIHFYICLFKYRETQQLLCEILVQRPYETRCCTNDNWRCGFNRMRRLDTILRRWSFPEPHYKTQTEWDPACCLTHTYNWEMHVHEDKLKPFIYDFCK